MTSVLLLSMTCEVRATIVQYTIAGLSVIKYYFEQTDAKTAEVHRFTEFLQRYYQQTHQHI